MGCVRGRLALSCKSEISRTSFGSLRSSRECGMTSALSSLKNGLPRSVGNRGSPLCDPLESGKPYLLRTFFIRSEEALASANWPKPGSMEARLALMIWLKVSFFMVFPFGRPPVFFFCLLLRRAARRFVVFLSLYLLLFFCCAFTIGRKVCVRHAAIAISIVDSSVHLKERIKKRSYILLRSLPQRRFG